LVTVLGVGESVLDKPAKVGKEEMQKEVSVNAIKTHSVTVLKVKICKTAFSQTKKI